MVTRIQLHKIIALLKLELVRMYDCPIRVGTWAWESFLPDLSILILDNEDHLIIRLVPHGQYTSEFYQTIYSYRPIIKDMPYLLSEFMVDCPIPSNQSINDYMKQKTYTRFIDYLEPIWIA